MNKKSKKTYVATESDPPFKARENGTASKGSKQCADNQGFRCDGGRAS